ncbi:MAG: ferritin-like domain-containing protein [Terriglobia bacterium]
MAKLNSLEELYLNSLEDLYDAEKRIVKALPKMADKASGTALRSALEHHLEQTKTHVARVEQIFRELGKPAKGETCDGMKGILDEGDDVVGDAENPAVRDAAIIAAAQRVEHYEMAGYGSARTWAQQLSDTTGADLLQQTLDEEKAADLKLTEIAVSTANPQAQGAAATG